MAAFHLQRPQSQLSGTSLEMLGYDLMMQAGIEWIWIPENEHILSFLLER